MATIKSFTDISQSKKLAEILPLESADMCWFEGEPFVEAVTGYEEERAETHRQAGMEMYPCWSLAALLGILPEIQGGKPIIALDDNYITYPHMNDLHTKADNLVDACYELILKLHELNLL